jgi:leader peptidase (prepilin peptidase)/N-methyltransferase
MASKTATVAWQKLCLLGPVWALALGFGLFAARYGLSPRFLGLAVGMVLLVGAAWLDSRIGLLPDVLTYPILWLGLALSWAGVTESLYVAVGGVFAGYLFLSLCTGAFRLIGRRDVLGGGDIKLLAGLGAWLGTGGVFLTLLLACVASIVWAMCRQRTWRPKGHYPFGPFLVFVALCVLCLAPVA